MKAGSGDPQQGRRCRHRRFSHHDPRAISRRRRGSPQVVAGLNHQAVAKSVYALVVEEPHSSNPGTAAQRARGFDETTLGVDAYEGPFEDSVVVARGTAWRP